MGRPHPAPAGLALLREAVAPAASALAALVAVGTVLGAVQALARAPVVPGARGAAVVLAGTLPEVLAVALPVAVLVGAVAAARSWAEGGEWLALAASGRPARAVLGPILGAAVAAGAVEALAAHLAAPAGHRLAAEALAAASADLRAAPGRPVRVGAALLRVGAAGGEGGWRDVVLASGGLVVAARAGSPLPGGRIRLEDGRALDVDAGWRLGFRRAVVRLPAARSRPGLAGRSSAELARFARDPARLRERLLLHQRTALALGTPLLALLGLPLGARRARPAVVALAAGIGWWAVLRACDRFAPTLGALPAAALPPGLVALAALGAWAGWRDR